jgi:exonuclease III
MYTSTRRRGNKSFDLSVYGSRASSTPRQIISSPGIGNKSKVEALKDFKSLANPYVILLQETKMEESIVLETTKNIFKSCIGIAVSSQGASGGITTLWDDQIWNLEVTLITQHWLLKVLKNRDSRNNITIINVYVPNSYSDKNSC